MDLLTKVKVECEHFTKKQRARAFYSVPKEQKVILTDRDEEDDIFASLNYGRS